MPKLIWDAVGERIFETGTSHGVLYPQDPVTGVYQEGVAWNGLTGVTESPGGAEPTDLFADDIKYASLRSAETFAATIEAYTYPDEFAPCDGSAEVAEGVYAGQQPRQPFGFSYRTAVGSDTDTGMTGYKLHLIYNSTASPSEKAYSTINDSPDAVTFSWETTSTPINITGYKPLSTLVIDSTKVDAVKLKELEDILYGTTSDPATLPLPDAVVAIFA